MPHNPLDSERDAHIAMLNIDMFVDNYDGVGEREYTTAQRESLRSLIEVFRQWQRNAEWGAYYSENSTRVEAAIIVGFATAGLIQESLRDIFSHLRDTVDAISVRASGEVRERLMFVLRRITRVQESTDLVEIARELPEIKQEYCAALGLDEDLGLEEDYLTLRKMRHVFDIDADLFYWSSKVESELDRGGLSENLMSSLKQAYMSLGQVAYELGNPDEAQSIGIRMQADKDEILDLIKTLVFKATATRETEEGGPAGHPDPFIVSHVRNAT